MKDACPSNRVIANALDRTLPELVKRYGRDKDCTKKQLSRTCADLHMAHQAYSYLCAASLSAEAFSMSVTENPDVNWEEVKNRAARMAEEYNRKRAPSGEWFYESGVGMTGGG